ncbi:hypothetical protein CERSUDRAFT_65155 [Gelatoporia subvermispora B]|uniref:Cytochrome P450 n=1 Tax=Ceriporiopsis subvermispora (strain B) TaxID=914234 RepID=M2RFC3_CERS8|nr:hypothetical protein CERSUDRAFT_65155 [Gelatoporia subvermispora B]
MPANIVLAIFLLTPLVSVALYRNAYNRLPLPPGPRALPFIGNLLSIPRADKYPWRVYAEWMQLYGDIIHMKVLGRNIIVLNSLRAVQDLIERRTSTYQDRGTTEIIKLAGWDWSLGMMDYGRRWREHRQLFHQFFNEQAVRAYEPYLRDGARSLLKRLYHTPEDPIRHFDYVITETILSMTYGIHAVGEDDVYVKLLQASGESIEEGLVAGSFWVDFLPALKYVPSWMPGTSWQKKVARWNKETESVREVPWANMVSNTPIPSIAANLSERIDELDGDEHAKLQEISKNVCAVVYAGELTPGGAGTLSAALQTLIFAMVLHPEAQNRAQQELDQVVGSERLPDFADAGSLPYTRALLKECMRWQPVAPLSVPRRRILHDPETFPEPDEFRPERYLKDGMLNPDMIDPAAVVFGTGRR